MMMPPAGGNSSGKAISPATGITGLSMLAIPVWVTNVFNGGGLILAVTISQITCDRETSDIG